MDPVFDLDLKKLRILSALAEHGTVTAAAHALGMTTSAVSQQLAALARQAAVPVIEPEGRRVRLTGGGRLLVRHADRILAQLEQAQAELAAYAEGAVGEVRVSSFATAIPTLLLPTIAQLPAGLRLQLDEAEASEALRRLTQGKVDMALTLQAHRSAPPGEDDLVRIPLLADPLDLALPSDHPLASAEVVELDDAAEEPWIFGRSGPWHEITLAACSAAGFTPRPAHHAENWHTILAMVAAGLGVALVPRLTQPETLPNLTIRSLEGSRPRRYVVAVVHAGTQHSPQLAAVLQILRQVAAQRQERLLPRPDAPA